MKPAPEHIDFSDLVDQVDWLGEVDSTNRFLAGQPAATGSRLVLTWNQTGGVGRMGRVWLSPPGQSLAMSLELGPDLTPADLSEEWLGALPLVVGHHLASAIQAVAPSVTVKWPNDVLIAGKKVAGILGELPDAGRVIVGVGINVWGLPPELPPAQATSLNLQGLSNPAELHTLMRGFIAALIDTLNAIRLRVPQGLWSMVRTHLGTLGEQVTVTFPDGQTRHGRATNIDHRGRLLVTTPSGANEVVGAGDIQHLRASAE